MTSLSDLYSTILLSYKMISAVCLAVFSRRPFSNAFCDFTSGYGALGLAASAVLSVLVFSLEFVARAYGPVEDGGEDILPCAAAWCGEL
jgi:hypothetical protein